MKLAIFGATGRMGLAIARLAHADPEVEIVGGACSASDPGHGRDIGELAGIGSIGVVTTADVASALLGADAVIDFSTASAVSALYSVAARHDAANADANDGNDTAEAQRAQRNAEEDPQQGVGPALESGLTPALSSSSARLSVLCASAASLLSFRKSVKA